MKNIIYRFLFNYIHRHWNIAIASVSDDLIPSNVKWMKHNYHDRWFADPFIIEENDETLVILVEEFMRNQKKARLARLKVDKFDCVLLENETILELSTHLSFPIFITIDDRTYLYPENGRAGKTDYYEYGRVLRLEGELSQKPLADAVIKRFGEKYFLFYTVGKECNGNRLIINSSVNPWGPYEPLQEIVFSENIARRAGNMFVWNKRIISPAQICNNAYGEGVSLQEVKFVNGRFEIEEVKRIYPSSQQYPNGLHTFNVFGSKVVLDGYKYKFPFLSRIYFKVRKGGI